MILESILAGGTVAILVTGVAIIRQVSRLSGVVENGLTDAVKDVKAEQMRAREEQDRQGARIDALYQRWAE